MNILYWNLNGRPILDLVVALAHERDIDVLILSECAYDIGVLLQRMNESGGKLFSMPYSPIPHPDPIILIRFPRDFMKPLADYRRITAKRLILPMGPDILIVAGHLPSKMNYSSEAQTCFARDLVKFIEEQENKVNHRRTVVVGDLNMNPFEVGIASTSGLHAVMTREIAMKNPRKVGEENYDFFYNPMWGHFGDRTPGPPGTYYYNRSGEPVNYYWNIFDQVLIRPDLLKYFNSDNLEIVDSVGSICLLDLKGKPDKTIGSDHLPIVFSLDLLKGADDEC